MCPVLSIRICSNKWISKTKQGGKKVFRSSSHFQVSNLCEPVFSENNVIESFVQKKNGRNYEVVLSQEIKNNNYFYSIKLDSGHRHLLQLLHPLKQVSSTHKLVEQIDGSDVTERSVSVRKEKLLKN